MKILLHAVMSSAYATELMIKFHRGEHLKGAKLLGRIICALGAIFWTLTTPFCLRGRGSRRPRPGREEDYFGVMHEAATAVD